MLTNGTNVRETGRQERMQTAGRDGTNRSEHTDEIRGQGETFRRQEWRRWGRGDEPGVKDDSVQGVLNLKKQMQRSKAGQATIWERVGLRRIDSWVLCIWMV